MVYGQQMANNKVTYYGFVAYLTFIGLIVAYQLNKDQKDQLTTWHIKNMFGLFIGLFISVFIQNSPVGFYLYWTVACFWLFCLVMAFFRKQIGIPWLSNAFQRWFKFLD